MDSNTLQFIKDRTEDLMKAPSCSVEAMTSAKKWIESIGTGDEVAATKTYMEELAQDILPIEALIAFTGSPEGEKAFGPEKANMFHAHGLDIKAKGGKYCDCPACTAVAAILTKKDEI